MTRALPFLWCLVAVGCNRCGEIDPPDTVNHTDTGLRDTSVDDSGAETGDPPPCAVPEVEPNGSESEALVLPHDTVGCGVFATPADRDQWAFAFDEPGWIGVYVDARSIGSSADPALTLVWDTGEVAVAGQLISEDVVVVFPSSGGSFVGQLANNTPGASGDDYRYEILVTRAKQPVDYNVDEVEPNDSPVGAQEVVHGSRVLGRPDAALDVDWYEVRVPAGKHTVRVEIVAFAAGSTGDFRLLVQDDAGTIRASVLAGEQGWEPDPVAVLTSSGDESLFVRVVEQSSRFGPGPWYLLAVSVEGS